jgi:hypothetical protein
MAKAKAAEEAVEEAPVATTLIWCGPGDRIVDVKDLFPDAATEGVPEDAEDEDGVSTVLTWEYSNGWMIDDLNTEISRRLQMSDGLLRPPSEDQEAAAVEVRKQAEAEALALAEAEKAAEQVRSSAYDAHDASDSSSGSDTEGAPATETDSPVIPDAGETIAVGTDTESGDPEALPN